MENVKRYSNEIRERVASLFEMSLSLDAVPPDLLEEKLSWSEPFEELERGDSSSFLFGMVGDLFKKVFHTSDLPNQYLQDSRYYWIGESYARIFLETGASFSRVILLLPIREMKDLFYPYHEMDPFRIVELYEEREKTHSVLEALKKKKGISYVEITKKTGISKASLFRMKDNDVLNRIGLLEAHRLAFALGCPERAFLKQTYLFE